MEKGLSDNIFAVILAAGRGTRMNSVKNKVLQIVGGKALITHTIDQLEKAGIGRRVCVVGYQAEQVKSVLGKSCQFVLQEPQLGTGQAVILALPQISPEYSTVLVINADDAIFYRTKTIKNMFREHLKSGAKMTILTSMQEKTNVSGRVIRNKTNQITTIKANSQMSPEQLNQNHEIVCGLYLFNRIWLEKNLPTTKRAKSGEYLLTDLIYLAIRQKGLTDVKLEDPNEWRSINTPWELKQARQLWKKLHS